MQIENQGCQGSKQRGPRITLCRLRESGWIALAFLAGWWLHPAKQVHAQGSAPMIQFESLSPNSALTVYYPDQRAIYVYQPAAVGPPKLNCAFYFQLGNAGAPVKRDPCKAPSFQP